MANPYDVIGVKRDASQKEIQKAFRQQAKKLHPDLNPGDAAAEQKFKELNAAYAIIGDADKRKLFDAGKIDETGQEAPERHYYRDYAGANRGGANPYRSGAGFADFDDAGDIFADIFGSAGGRGGASFRVRGADVRYRLELDFLDAINGGTRTVQLSDGSTLDINVPPGTRDGQVLRLRGRGQPGLGEGSSAGDALVEIHVRPHPLFKLDGDDIRFDLPITLGEAVLGDTIRVPTPSGPVMAKVPKWSSGGKVLRLRGKGAPRRDGTRGDAYARLEIVLPEEPDPALEKFVADWPAGKASEPRQKIGA